MADQPTLVLTGGGTAGHVAPNLALAPVLRERGFAVAYIGAHDGMERELCARAEIPFHPVHVGKLRRYLSARHVVQNLIDPFRTVQGLFEAVAVLRRLEPRVVFSKGGFVGVPPVLAARLCGIPAVVHESDLSPGLANKICFPFATRICVAYPETIERVARPAKTVHTGTPIRREITQGDAARARQRWQLAQGRPVVMVFGGSQGARAINQAVRELVRRGTEWQFLHVCGAGQLDPSLDSQRGYRQFEYLHAEWGDALACADAVVCRGGANSLTELLAVQRPAVVIPLPSVASRGDQLENAARFADRGYGLLLPQEKLTPASLQDSIDELLRRSGELRDAMRRDAGFDSTERVVAVLEGLAGRG